MYDFTLSKYSKVQRWAMYNHGIETSESLSPNQVSSKQWLIEELLNYYNQMEYPAKVEIVGSWYGYPLIDFLTREIAFHTIQCWDIDSAARAVCRRYLEVFDQEFVDVYSKNYWQHERNGSDASLLINTSSEHMTETFADMKRSGHDRFYTRNPLVVIQSNDMYHIPEHVNCVEDASELASKHRLEHVHYLGWRPIVQWEDDRIVETKYKRFMIIGRLYP